METLHAAAQDVTAQASRWWTDLEGETGAHHDGDVANDAEQGHEEPEFGQRL